MQGYVEIMSDYEFDAVLGTISHLHDSLTKEIHLVNRGYVDSVAGTVMSFQFDVRVLFQSQWPPHALEFVFVDVDDLSLLGADEHWGAGVQEVKRSTTDERSFVLRVDEKLRISARRVFYRTPEDALGDRVFFSGEVPSPYTIVAKRFEDDWRQCGNCSNVWEAAQTVIFARCPSCGLLTEYAV